jgi:(p)ppGpp synthase/HD superfamily hydrolase
MNRAEFFSLIARRPSDELVLIQHAYWIAKVANRPFVRDSGERSFEHARAVAVSLIEHGYTGTEFIIRALLHDLFEDTNTPPNLIFRTFGFGVYCDLCTLSKDVHHSHLVTGWITKTGKKSPKEYFDEIFMASELVKLVKLADRLDNLKDCGIWKPERRERYIIETEQYVLPLARMLGFPTPYEREIKAALTALMVY